MVPQPSSFTRPKQSGKFTARCVVSIAGRCFLSAVAQQWSGHGSGLQIISGSLLNRNLWRPRLAHEVGSRPVLKTTCCLRRSRAPSKKREANYGGDHANRDRSFRTFKIHAIYRVTCLVANQRSKLERRLSQHFGRRQIRYKVYRVLAAPSRVSTCGICSSTVTKVSSWFVTETYKTKVLLPPLIPTSKIRA